MKKLTFLLFMIVALSGFSQKFTNTWDGSSNYFWSNPNNWSLNHVPRGGEDVVIPSGLSRYPGTTTNVEIKSLTIQSGAYVGVGVTDIIVYDDINVYGSLRLYDDDSRIFCSNDIIWHSGSTALTTGTCEIYCYGTWEFKAGADVQLDSGYAGFYGTSNQYIRSKDADCYFNDVWVNKSAGLLGLSSQSTTTCKIKGNLNFYGSNYDFNSPSGQIIQVGGFLHSNDPSINIALANGTIEFTGNTSPCFIRPQPGDYFNNLTVNTGSCELNMTTTNTTVFVIENNITINSGSLDVNSMDLIVGGNWSNNVGEASFNERDRKVTFSGGTHQYCSDETFYTLEVNKSLGALLTNGTDVVCAEYDWTSGAVNVMSGSFTANDLLDNAIQGIFYVNTGGIINLHNDGGYINLKGDLYIYGGEFNVYGGSIASYWPYQEDASITMSGGVLDIKEQGIHIYNSTSYALNDNITGGRIKCAGYLYNDRADFTPNAGIFEMYGSEDANIRTINGGRFWDLTINKAGIVTFPGPQKTKDPEMLQTDSSPKVNLASDLLVHGTTSILMGELHSMGYDIEFYGDVEIYDGGLFSVTSPSQVSLDNFDAINVNSGGTLQCEGELGNEVLFTRNAGNYSINIASGGTLSASHSIFEYTGANGVQIMSGATIDPVHPLNNCTFRYGKAGGTLLTINNSQTLTIDGAEFYTGGSENYNVAKTVNAGEITFTNFGGDFADKAHENDQYGRIHWFIPELTVLPANQNVSGISGSTTFDVTSNTSWTISETVPWLTVDVANGSGNYVLNVDYEQNSSGLVRTGSITVAAEGISPSVVIGVIQENALVQTVIIPEGWSGLSAYIMPADTDIENIFSSIENELLIAMTMDGYYYPIYNTNTIGNWGKHSAYKVKTTGPVSLDIIGIMETNRTVDLVDGWNLMPVVSECPVDVEDLFAPVMAELEIVKEVAGYGLYWPWMGINNLGTLNPGKAYFVLTTNSVSVTFQDCTKNALEGLPKH